MNDHIDPIPTADDDADPVLSEAGARLREGSSPISPSAVEVAVLRRRSRRLGVLAVASVAVVALLGGALVAGVGDDEPERQVASEAPGAPTVDEVDQIVDGLDDQPIDPTEVQLLGTVSTFADCDELIGDLRRVGAEHVGSRGFGGFGERRHPGTDGWRAVGGGRVLVRRGADGRQRAVLRRGRPPSAPTCRSTGVDELDFVKAVGNLIYDLDQKGNLRITDVRTMQVLSTLDVTPPEPEGDEGGAIARCPAVASTSATSSSPTARSPSSGRRSRSPSPSRATRRPPRPPTSYMTVAFVDATDPAAPTLTDRVRVEGSLVSARLVEGEIRLVTTSHMADLGFLMPTTPTSVPKALDAEPPLGRLVDRTGLDPRLAARRRRAPAAGAVRAGPRPRHVLRASP